MFFRTEDGMRPAPLNFNPMNALVMPRPIAWISTLDSTGVPNLAPYSYFNLVCADPAYVMFAPNAKAPDELKDTWRNVNEVPEFVVNLVSEEDGAAMNRTSAPYPRTVDEFEACGVAAMPSTLVRPARVATARAALECRVHQTIALPLSKDGRENFVVIGAVLGVFIADDVIANGRVDERKLHPLTRLGYMNYGTLGEVFEMNRPA